MTQPGSQADETFLRRALELAERGRRSGQPHAEVNALCQAGEQGRGATLYVTLEACSHHGKTPPCTAAIIASGVRRGGAAPPDPPRPPPRRGLPPPPGAG